MFELLSKDIQKWLMESGFFEETEVQRKAYAPIANGENVLITAPTGYGKTLSAILPLFNKYSKSKKEGIKILYICPLRALNRDILQRISLLGSRIWMEVDIRHGDTKQSVRLMQSKMPPDVLITTPETLQAILTGKRMRENLKSVKAVVVDEIHELVNSKRGTQLSIALERLGVLAGNFQRIGLSATIGDKDTIAKYLSPDCKNIDVSGEKEYDVSVELAEPNKEDSEISDELLVSKNLAYCLRRIKEVVESGGNAIIFTNTRESAELLGTKIRIIADGVEVHHSSLSKDIRIDVENRMKSGELRAIIATSSLELGIDVGLVEHIVQFMSPRQVTKLVQRVGRSGHNVGRVSRGIILTITKDDFLEAKSICRNISKWLEPPTFFEKSGDVLCHQIVGFCMDLGETELEFIFERVKKSYLYRNLKKEEFYEIVELMGRIGLIRRNNSKIYRTKKGLLYYFSNLSVIPTEKKYVVFDSEKMQNVGVLHQGFVVQNVNIGSKFILNGQVWQVVESKRNVISVIRGKNEEGAIPTWSGEMIPVSHKIASEVGKSKKHAQTEIESQGKFVLIKTYFGSKVNQTLGSALAAVLSQETGTTVGIKTDAYRILLNSSGLKRDMVMRWLKKEPSWIEEAIRHSLMNSSLFTYRFWHIARRFGIISKDAELNFTRIQKLIDIFRGSAVIEEVFNEIFAEKMDIKLAEKLMEKASIKISDWSDESQEFAKRISGFVRVSDEKELSEHIKKRLLSKRFSFVCTNCWNKLGTFPFKRFPKECPKCKSSLLGFAPKHQEVDRDFFRKTSPIYLYYKEDACFVMAGFGIGPQTATRILATPYKSREDLLKRIIEAERNFLKNRRYWSKP